MFLCVCGLTLLILVCCRRISQGNDHINFSVNLMILKWGYLTFCVCVFCLYVYVRMNVHICTLCVMCAFLCSHAQLCACLHTCMCTGTCVYVCNHVVCLCALYFILWFMCVCVHMCMHVCLCVFEYIGTKMLKIR